MTKDQEILHLKIAEQFVQLSSNYDLLESKYHDSVSRLSSRALKDHEKAIEKMVAIHD